MHNRVFIFNLIGIFKVLNLGSKYVCVFSGVYYDPFLAAHAASAADPNYRLQVSTC